MSSTALTGPLLSDVSRSADGAEAAPSWSFQNSPTMGFYRVSANVLGLSTAGVQRMVVDASGNVGIGTASPSAKLEVSGNIGFGTGGTFAAGQLYSDSNWGVILRAKQASPAIAEFAFCNANNTERMRIDASGRMLINTTNNTAMYNAYAPSGVVGWYQNRAGSGANDHMQFYTDGVLYAKMTNTGGWQNSGGVYGGFSDSKLKENIVDATPKLADICKVRIVNYNLKTQPELKQLGVIAQELEQVFPALVEESKDLDSEGKELGTTTKAVKYSIFVPMLVKAIQELSAKVEEQSSRIDAQAAEIEALKAK